jgi:F-box and WD-40 domain protein CDC4
MLQDLLYSCSPAALQAISGISHKRLRRDFISELPLELGFQILSYLPTKTLGQCFSVSSQWKKVLEGPGSELAVWKKRLLKEKWYSQDEVYIYIYIFLRNFYQNIISPPRMYKKVEACIKEPYTKENPPPQMYLNLYRRHFQITQNWYNGKYRHISFPGHGSNVVTCLQFDKDRIVSGSDDNTIHIYDTNSGTLEKKLTGHDGGVWALQYWKHILVSGSTDRSIRIWNMKDGSCKHIFEGHTSTVRCLQIVAPTLQPDGTMAPKVPLIVTGSRDTTLRIWTLPDPEQDAPYMEPAVSNNPYFRHVLLGHTSSVRAISGSGNILVSGSYDCTVRVWDLEKGQAKFTFTGHREKVYSVGYSAELERAVSGSMDATIRVWCTKTGVPLFTLEGHSSLIGLLEISRQFIVSAAADATLRIWNPMTGQCLGNLVGHPAAITCFHHDPELNRIVSGSEGGVKVRIFLGGAFF